MRIFSSRKNSGLAKKEIGLIGIKEKDREVLINLLCKLLDTRLTDKAEKRIQQLTEGHPVSTKLLIKNYQKILICVNVNIYSIYAYFRPIMLIK